MHKKNIANINFLKFNLYDTPFLAIFKIISKIQLRLATSKSHREHPSYRETLEIESSRVSKRVSRGQHVEKTGTRGIHGGIEPNQQRARGRQREKGRKTRGPHSWLLYRHEAPTTLPVARLEEGGGQRGSRGGVKGTTGEARVKRGVSGSTTGMVRPRRGGIRYTRRDSTFRCTLVLYRAVKLTRIRFPSISIPSLGHDPATNSFDFVPPNILAREFLFLEEEIIGNFEETFLRNSMDENIYFEFIN